MVNEFIRNSKLSLSTKGCSEVQWRKVVQVLFRGPLSTVLQQLGSAYYLCSNLSNRYLQRQERDAKTKVT